MFREIVIILCINVFPSTLPWWNLEWNDEFDINKLNRSKWIVEEDSVSYCSGLNLYYRIPHIHRHACLSEYENFNGNGLTLSIPACQFKARYAFPINCLPPFLCVEYT